MPTHTIAENLERLNDALEDIREAVYDKGGPLINFFLEGAASAISEIPAGGNSNTVYNPDTGEGNGEWFHYIETFTFPEYKYPPEYGDDTVYGPTFIYKINVAGLEADKCPNLTTIKFPSTVETIDSNTFSNGFSQLTTIIINKPPNSISGAPWGATNATVIWTG